MGFALKKFSDNLSTWATHVEKLQSDIYSHMVTTPEGKVLIDPVTPEDGNFETIVSQGPFDAIILLNEHHIRDAAVFKEKTNAPIYLR